MLSWSLIQPSTCGFTVGYTPSGSPCLYLWSSSGRLLSVWVRQGPESPISFDSSTSTGDVEMLRAFGSNLSRLVTGSTGITDKKWHSSTTGTELPQDVASTISYSSSTSTGSEYLLREDSWPGSPNGFGSPATFGPETGGTSTIDLYCTEHSSDDFMQYFSSTAETTTL